MRIRCDFCYATFDTSNELSKHECSYEVYVIGCDRSQTKDGSETSAITPHNEMQTKSKIVAPSPTNLGPSLSSAPEEIDAFHSGT